MSRASILIACTIGLAGCAAPRSDSGRVNVASEPPASSSKTTGVQAASDGSLSDVCRRFARDLADELGERPCTIAVLPVMSQDRVVTAGSEMLADEIMGALADGPYRVVDRQSLKAVMTELDLGAAFDKPSEGKQIPGADVIIVGRYALAAGRLQLHLKAVDVPRNQFLCLRSYETVADRRIRRHMPPPSDPAGEPGEVRFEETDGGVRIRASYTESGADNLRLLDRVRQRIRRALSWYLTDAVGLSLDAEKIDARFRRGRETDCTFSPGSVTLEMEFGVNP